MKALLVVDLQNDFLPTGALPVPHGDEIIPLVEEIAEYGVYDVVVATRDWHPPNHCSFEAQGGPWPPHCVQDTPGAELAWTIPNRAFMVEKGAHQNREAYSGFDGTILSTILDLKRITNVDVVGLALDYCVKATALDAVALGFETCVLADATRSVSQEALTVGALFEGLEQRGVKIATT